MVAYPHNRQLVLARMQILIHAAQQMANQMVRQVHKADQGHPAGADPGSAPRLLQGIGGHSRLQQGRPSCNHRFSLLCMVSTRCARQHASQTSNAALVAQRTHTIMSSFGPLLPQAPGAAVSGVHKLIAAADVNWGPCQWSRFKHQTKHLTAYIDTLQPGERLILVRPTKSCLRMPMSATMCTATGLPQRLGTWACGPTFQGDKDL